MLRLDLCSLRSGKVRPGGNLRYGFRCLTVESESFQKLLYVARGGRAGECRLLPHYAAPAAGCAASESAARSWYADRLLDLSCALGSDFLHLSFASASADQRTASVMWTRDTAYRLIQPIQFGPAMCMETAVPNPQPGWLLGTQAQERIADLLVCRHKNRSLRAKTHERMTVFFGT